MAKLITRVLQHLSLRITYKLFIIICLSRAIWKPLLKECLYSHMGTLAYMLNAEHSSASKLPWSFWKERLFFVLTQDCFFLVLTMGAVQYTQLPSEQPRTSDVFHKTLYYYQQNAQSERKWSKGHRPPFSLGTWVWNKCRNFCLGVRAF